MNVRLLSDALSTSPASKVDAVRSDRASARGEGAAPSAASEGAAASDRVEISAESRARAASAASLPTDSSSLEIEVARVALRAGASLSDSRLHELRERVRTGYYDQPTAIDRIGEAAARDLADRPS